MGRYYLRAERVPKPMSRFALVDCNNFFVSCERIFRPDLWDKPVAVLSNNDGCVVARSNEVKALGVPMGVPLFKVRDIVHDHRVTLFSANFELYGDISQRIVTLLREETPLIEVYSIDECFVDLSHLPLSSAHDWGKRVADRIYREIGVPVSVGVAPTKTLAKVTSTFAKTHGDGVWTIESDAERSQLLSQLPVEEVWGIGRQIAPKLRDMGVSTAGQLVQASDDWLNKQFNITGLKMVDELRGVSRIPFGDGRSQRKTIMRSRMFGHRVRAYYELETAVATFAAQVAARVRAQNSVCSGIITYLSVADPESSKRQRGVTRHLTFVEPTAHTGTVIAGALEALSVLYDKESAYKKAGVIATGIHDVAEWQTSLMAGPTATREQGIELMNALDAVNKRYGSGTVWHASEAAHNRTWQSKREKRSPSYTTSFADLPILKTQ